MTDAAPPPPPRWRLRYGDQVFGPFERRELEALLDEGRLDRMSLLAPEGGGEDWRPAAEITELADLFARHHSVPAKAKPPRLPAVGQPDTTILHVIYALYAAAFLIAPTVVAGVIVAYVKRGDAVGTWQASHHDWLIRTFWWTVLFMIIGGLTTFIGIGVLIVFLAGLWFLYRVIKGWVRLSQLRALEDPTGFF